MSRYSESLLPHHGTRGPAVLQFAKVEETEPARLVVKGEATDQGSLDSAWNTYLRKVWRFALLSPQEEKAVAARVERGDKVARNIMIHSNLRLVLKIARPYLCWGVPYSDLVAEGNIGLIRAVDRFKLAKECRFSTYATWWIRRYIERALDYQSRTVRVPVHHSEMMGKIVRTTKILFHELQDNPSAEEVANRLQVALPRVLEVMGMFQQTLSIDPHLEHVSEELSLCEILEDINGTSSWELIENLDAYEMVSRCLDTLTEKEKRVLSRRFGLADQQPETLDTIGRSFNVTRQRIGQIELEALQKLRRLVHVELQGGVRIDS
jgi:RNA polymerase primary sigma factor